MKLNCFILRTTTVAGLGVPIFRGFTVVVILSKLEKKCVHRILMPPYSALSKIAL